MSILYPEYKGDPNTWKTTRLPALPEKLLKALTAVGTVAGMPRFRVVSGATHTEFHEGSEDLPAGNYLAYMSMGNVQFQDGFIWSDNGVWHKVAQASDVPKGKLAVPNYTYRDFGIPRYMVEIYRDKREPGIFESGYVWAWTIDTRSFMEIAGERVEISHFRQLSEFDIQHAKDLAGILDRASEQSRQKHVEKFNQKREKAKQEREDIHDAQRDESVERFMRDELKLT